jgi:hypothetical protein
MRHIAFLLMISLGSIAAEWKFPCPEADIAAYTAFRVSEVIVVDGRLDEPAWKAPRSPKFVDIITGKPAIHDTQAAVLWDDENLYVGFWVDEPLVQAKYTNHNDPIYYDNDVEVFIAGKDAYYEFEVNAFNTVYEAFFIWKEAYESGGFSALSDFERSKTKPFNGVSFKSHPRGERLGAFDWTFPGKKTAVAIDGTINEHKDRDRGWTVELSFPWKGMGLLLNSSRPRDGDVLRMDFSRFNTYKAAPPDNDSGGWVWTRHGVWDSHIPECFVKVRFSTNESREVGFVSLFDGSTLNGWSAPDPSYWSVEDGAITGRITKEHQCHTNQYLVWLGGNLADFELKLKSRIMGEGAINNGFQFRSRVLPDRDVAGYQVDNNLKTDWLVRLYDEHARHTLAWRGQRTVFDREGKATHTKIEEAQGPAPFKLEDWHEYHLIFAAVALGVLAFWLFSAPTPPTVRFADGRSRRVLKVSFGTNHIFSPEPLWKKSVRLVLPQALEKPLGPLQQYKATTYYESVAIFLEPLAIRQGSMLGDAAGMRVEALFPDGTASPATWWDSPSQKPTVFGNYPRGEKELVVRFWDGDQPVRLKVSNLKPGTRASWTPQALPQTNYVPGTAVILKSCHFLPDQFCADVALQGRSLTDKSVGWMQWHTALFDPWGNWYFDNYRQKPNLPGAKAERDFKLRAAGLEYISAGFVNPPVAGRYQLLVPTSRMTNWGVQFVGLFGPGTYEISKTFAIKIDKPKLLTTNTLHLRGSGWLIQCADPVTLSISQRPVSEVRVRERIGANEGQIFAGRRTATASQGAMVAQLFTPRMATGATNLEVEVIVRWPPVEFFVQRPE